MNTFHFPCELTKNYLVQIKTETLEEIVLKHCFIKEMRTT